MNSNLTIVQKIIVFLFLSISNCLLSQVKETYIWDTALVRVAFSKGSSDTSYYLINDTAKGKWIIYYDELKKNKAVETKNVSFDDEEFLFERKTWYRNGKIKSITEPNKAHDTVSMYEFYSNGKLKIETVYVKNDKYKGGIFFKEYYDNGQIKSTPPDLTSNKRQHLISYYSSGAKHFEFNWVNGISVGESIEYFENGTIKEIGNYMELPHFEPGEFNSMNWPKKTSLWKEYDEKGKLIKKELYDNGKLVEKK